MIDCGLTEAFFRDRPRLSRLSATTATTLPQSAAAGRERRPLDETAVGQRELARRSLWDLNVRGVCSVMAVDRSAGMGCGAQAGGSRRGGRMLHRIVRVLA
jgi:hypothetical protein